VLENIERHLRLKEQPDEAAINGRSEIGLAAIAITMVDIVVFLPIAFMGGMLGQYFRQFGITVAVATAFSLLMSFTLTPMLASRWMKSEMDKERDEEITKKRAESKTLTFKDRLDILAGRVFGVLESFLRSLDRLYKGILEWALGNRFLTVTIGIVSLLVVVAMVTTKGGGTASGGAQGSGGMPPLNARLLISFVTLVLTATAMAVNRRSKGIALIFGISMIFIAMTVYLPFGFEFFPQNDDGQLKITARTPAGTSLEATDRVVGRLEEIVSKLPEMKTVRYQVSNSHWWNPTSWGRHHTESETGYIMAMVGSGTTGMAGSGDTGSQYANVTVQLVDKRHRKRSTQDVVNWISQQTAHIPGAELITVSVSSGSGPSGGLEKQIQGQKREDVAEMANKVAAVMRKVAGTVDVDISYKPNTPERRIVVDKYRAAKVGMSVSEVSTAVRTAIDGDDTVKLRQGGTEYPIRVHYDLSQRNKASDIDSLIIGTRNGAPIYLSDIAKIESAFAPNKIERINRQQVVSVTANIAGGYQMGNVNQSIETALAKLPKIAGTTVTSGGMTKRMGESFVSIFMALVLAVLLVYMLMGALFESFLTPLVVMFSLPQAMIGALLALLVTGQSMGITAMIGIIMLMGLVSKNAILLIDYTNTLMSRGMSRNEALLEAGPTRLRPILMTTLAMVGGMLPTALALTQGSETRSPMATAVIGGLLLSTALTLVVIPVVFTIVDDAWKWLLRSFFPEAYRKSMIKQSKPEHESALVDT
jgi:HAE1 family hydrophobic/amphiphilic exporter-1